MEKFVSRYDLIALQEVMDDLSGIRRLHQSLAKRGRLGDPDTPHVGYSPDISVTYDPTTRRYDKATVVTVGHSNRILSRSDLMVRSPSKPPISASRLVLREARTLVQFWDKGCGRGLDSRRPHYFPLQSPVTRAFRLDWAAPGSRGGPRRHRPVHPTGRGSRRRKAGGVGRGIRA